MSQPELDFSAGAADGPDSSTGNDLQPEGTFTVSQLAELIRNRLRAGLEQGVWVRGEIQGWNGKGAHAYFTLADDKSETKSVIPVACFAPQRDRLRPLLKKANLVLGDGMKVLIHGSLDFYAPTGRLTLKMDGLSPRYTLGDLAQQRDQVLRRLMAKGLHETNKRRPLSPVPLRVGVVTSVGSAAWHDFENELSRSGIGFELSVCNVRVQGDRAESMVVAAITTLARRPLDAIVVIRGGGARNELAVFDSEAIAVAIAASPVPVLTGLGHEIDRSIADEVAKASYKTPTACAQALVTRGPAVPGRRRAGVRDDRNGRPRPDRHVPSKRSAPSPTASPAEPTPPSAAPRRVSTCGSPASERALAGTSRLRSGESTTSRPASGSDPRRCSRPSNGTSTGWPPGSRCSTR